MPRNKLIGLLLGPILFLLVWVFFQAEGFSTEARAVLGITCWIACWWVSEAVPIPITSLLPLSLFPIMGVMSIKAVAQPYISPIIFLFIGGFILALALEKWNLHRRIALSIILRVGTRSRLIVLGFMLATALLSMWISNTATTMMMVPIAMAIVFQLELMQGKGSGKDESGKLGKVLVMAIAFSASIGGLGTLVGTPTTLIMVGYIEEVYHQSLDFANWMMYGIPLVVILIPIVWLHLTRIVFPLSDVEIEGGKAEIQRQLDELGPMSREEKWVLGVFGMVAIAWIFRSYLLAPLIPGIHDTIIALVGATLLFIIPERTPGKTLMDWETASRLPWGILLLFGGAFAVAAGFESSGLVSWIAGKLGQLEALGLLLIMLIIVAFVNYLTEIVQNMATCTLMLPVLAALAPALDVHPYILMVPMCVASSCAFMLPFATAPNAIAFGSGYLEMKDMIRAGFWLNFISVIIIVFYSYLALGELWDLQISPHPGW
ncbi:MAG: SLC13 family permease [Bacteroidota bacterium]